MVRDIIRVKDKYYIRAGSSLAEEHTQVLKHGDMFAVFNQDGNIRPLGFENHGLYFEGARFLSRFVLTMDNKHPVVLSSAVKEDNELMTVDLTNPDLDLKDQGLIPKGQVHVSRCCFLKDQVFYDRIRAVNYGLEPVETRLSLEFEADYLDIFEVRGLGRQARGRQESPQVQRNKVVLCYQGLDDVERRTIFLFSPSPLTVEARRAEFALALRPKQEKVFDIRVVCQTEKRKQSVSVFTRAAEGLRRDNSTLKEHRCRVETSNEQFNDWLNRSLADLFMMLTRTPDGWYPYAGIPWFSTVFGRDGIITALETLWLYPRIARGVLRYLSRHQAKEFSPERDAEPGKILHEVRKGEMARLGEIPFGYYYGSVDSTILYLILAGYYYQRTKDMVLLQEIWPALIRAMEWIDVYGDKDRDGFVEYERKAIGGLSQQGWKDSEDSVFHRDGILAEPPIALCEVQAYVYEAKTQMAYLSGVMEDKDRQRGLLKAAERLKKQFVRAFWSPSEKILALALDSQKRPCLVRTSNAGQCLFSGILPSSIARVIRRQMLDKTFFSGWGIRTVAANETRFNPMSYHNGSVWPHDNALIAYGLDRYGYKEEAVRVMTGFFDASLFTALHRLPELFCGFSRRSSEGPTLYPVACNPQAWASAAVFMFLQACLGVRIDAVGQKIYFCRPTLPAYLQEVRIRNLAVGKAMVDINLEYHAQDVGIKVIRRQGKVDVIALK